MIKTVFLKNLFVPLMLTIMLNWIFDARINIFSFVAMVVVYRISQHLSSKMMVRSFFGIEKMVSFDTRLRLDDNYVERDFANTGLHFNNDLLPHEKPSGSKIKYVGESDINEVLSEQRYTQKFKTPGYFLVNNNMFSKNGVSHNNIKKLIKKSKMKDLYNQHNFNIVSSPHTHLGKKRGFLNQEKIF